MVLCANALTKARTETGAVIYAFVLMNNHYHLLLKTPHKNVDHFLRKRGNDFCADRQIYSDSSHLRTRTGWSKVPDVSPELLELVPFFFVMRLKWGWGEQGRHLKVTVLRRLIVWEV